MQQNIIAILGGGRPRGNTNGKPRIAETSHLNKAYDFGKKLYL